MLKKVLQHTNTHRQAAKYFCNDKDIPLKDMITMLDTNYASKAQTCGSDTDNSDGIANRHKKAGLEMISKKVVGLKWRSSDVSGGQN